MLKKQIVIKIDCKAYKNDNRYIASVMYDIERDEETGIIRITVYGKIFEYDGMLNLRKQKEDELKECMQEDEMLSKKQQLEQVQENENKIE